MTSKDALRRMIDLERAHRNPWLSDRKLSDMLGRRPSFLAALFHNNKGVGADLLAEICDRIGWILVIEGPEGERIELRPPSADLLD